MPHLSRLDQSTSRQYCGGKAHRLAEILNAGFRVPESLVLRSTALEAFLHSNGLAPKVQSWISDYPHKSIQDRTTAFEALRLGMMEQSMPAQIEDEIKPALEALLDRSPCGLVLRSSARCEDADDASFAGVFDSRAGLLTVSAAFDAIKAIWCSLWAPAALTYMDRMGIAPGIDGMAVLIQPLLAAEFAGVAYTAETATGNPFRLEIHSVRGLSMDLMDGSGEGAFHLFDWASGELLDSRAGNQTRATFATPAGPAAGTADASRPNSTDLGRLCEVARALDDHFNSRVDIEWVLDAGEVWIVQARSLTGLPEYFPVSLDASETDSIFELPTFVIPLRKDTARNLITPLYDHFDEMELWFRHHPTDIHFTGFRWHPRDFNGHRYCIRGADRTFIETFRDNWAGLKPWLDANEPRYRARWDRHTEEIREITARAFDGMSGTQTAQELIPVWVDVVDRVMGLLSFGWSAPQCMGWMFEALFRVVMTNAGVPYRLADLIGGSDNSASFLFTRDLQDFARQVDDPAAVGILLNAPLSEVLQQIRRMVPDGPFISGLDTLCWKHGKLPPRWADRPAFWWDEPQTLLAIIHAIKQVRLGNEQDVEHTRRLARRRAEAYQRSLKATFRHANPGGAGEFDSMVDKLRVWTQALNDRHLVRVCWNAEKELVWQLGTRLTEQGLLMRPVDILCLRVEDLSSIAALKEVGKYRDVYLERKAEYDHYRRYSPPPVIGRTRPLTEAATPDRDIQELSGTGMSGAAVSGKARHVKDLYEPGFLDSLDSDDILILPEEHAFVYADWHSIFMLVKGVVSPGRPSHHLSQVARECDIAVIGYVKGDLQQIHDGAQIAIDPASGSIRLT